MVAKKGADILVETISKEFHVTLSFRKHGIYHIKVQDNEIYTLDSFNFSQKFRSDNPNFNPKVAIFELGNFSSVDTKTREIAIVRENSPFIAEAYIANNLGQRILIRHYARIMNAKGINVQMFESYTTAKSWVLSVQRQSKG